MQDVREVISDQNAYYLNQLNFIDDLNSIVNSTDSVIKISYEEIGKLFSNAIFCGYVIESIDTAYLLDYKKFNELEPTRCILNIRLNPKYKSFKLANEIIKKFKEKYNNVLTIYSVDSSKKAAKDLTLKAFFLSDKLE